MNWQPRSIAANGEATYDVVFDSDDDDVATCRYRVPGMGGQVVVEAVNAGATHIGIARPEVERAIGSFHHARTVVYPPSKRAVRNVPPGFDPTPLRLQKIHAVGDAEYQVTLTEPDGRVVAFIMRVDRKALGDASIGVLELVAGKRFYDRIYPMDVHAAIGALHDCRAKKEQDQGRPTMTLALRELSSICKNGPAGVRRWLAEHRAAPGETDEPDRLLAVAQFVAARAREGLEVDWLELAVELYRQLSRMKAKREEATRAALALRAYFIAKLGTETGHPLLAIRDLVDEFRDMTARSREEVMAEARKWPELDIERIRELLVIKGRLAAFELLERKGMLAEYPDMRSWLSTRDQLP